MSETKIQVPEGMIKAINEHWRHGVQLEGLIEAALHWLIEKGFDEKEINAYCEANFKGYDGTAQRIGFRMGIDYVRRMFLAPEPEVPEAIKDLLEGPEEPGISAREANWRVIEAYRRGQQSKVIFECRMCKDDAT